MFLALREFKHAKLRFLLISLIMILISFLVLFVSGLAKGLSFDNASSIDSMASNYFVLQKESGKQINHSMLTESQINEVQKLVDEKNSATLGVQMTTFLKDGTSKKIDATLFGIDVNGLAAPKVIEGEMINNSTKNEVVGDLSLKEKGIKLGDNISDQISGKEFKIVGFTENQSYSHAPVIHMNYKEWSMVNNKNSFNAIALKTNESTAKKVNEKVSGVEVINKKQALKGIPGYKEEQGSLLMMIVFLFFIGAFVLAVFFYIITIQKINQFGVLKAIGSKTSYLAKNIIFQVLALTLLSLIISISITFGLSKVLPADLPFVFDAQLIIGSSLLFLFVAIVGSLISLLKVVKIDAIEAIGRAF
ncbi:ABC transporter permease [Gottfriedia acidiceleris]|uniref:ABC transporter permease n=1 Tax=Gottfriedia acidiceleris TaxID=371036 RepID=UPI000B438519|nr:ABC transporter permease [Gottfriedia acidiceleris]